MIKIAKFGGSSVASAKQFRKVKGIVESDPDRRFVVVSAAGKRFSGDNKITDLLLLVNAHVQYHVDCTALLADIQQRFQDIADELGLKWPVAEKFEAFARLSRRVTSALSRSDLPDLYFRRIMICQNQKL